MSVFLVGVKKRRTEMHLYVLCVCVCEGIGKEGWKEAPTKRTLIAHLVYV